MNLFKDNIIGYSDHSVGTQIPKLAVALGAKIVEKHFVKSKKQMGPDVSCSMDPSDLSEMVSEFNNISLAIKFNSKNDIEIIGSRHGEKLYETLATSEELRRSEDMGDYYKIALDSRDLNYAKYFTEGDVEESIIDDYHSHNTVQLEKEDLKTLLLSLPEVQQELELQSNAVR